MKTGSAVEVVGHASDGVGDELRRASALSSARDPAADREARRARNRSARSYSAASRSLQHVELERADDADDRRRRRRCGRKTWTTPSSAICCSASRSFLAFMASSSGRGAGFPARSSARRGRRCPRPRSACRRCAACRGSGCRRCRRRRPRRRCARSWAKKNCGALSAHRLAGAHQLRLHAARQLARADAHEGDAVAVVRVHVRLDLEDEAGHRRLAGLDRALVGLCARAAAGR